MYFWRLLFRFVPAYKWRIIWYVIFNVLTSVFCIFSFATIIPLLQIIFGISDPDISFVKWNEIVSFSSALDILKNNTLFYLQNEISISGANKALLLIGSFLIVTSALANLFSYFAYYIRIPIRTGVSRDLRGDVYSKIIYIPLEHLMYEKKGDFVSRMTSDVEEVDYGIGTTLDMLIKDPVQIIVYVVTMFGISVFLSLEALILLFVCCAIMLGIGMTMKKVAMQGQKQRGQILTSFEEVISHNSVIKSFNLGELLIGQFESVNENARNIFNKINRRYSIAFPLTEFLIVTIIAVLLWLGGQYVMADDSPLDASEFIYFLMVFYSIIPPMRDMIKATFGIRKAMASVERLNKILKVENPHIVESDVSLADRINEVEQDSILVDIRDLYLSLAGKTILNGFDLKIRKGQKIAITGDVGRGKSTLVALLLKLYECPKQSIFIAGEDLSCIAGENIREVISYVPQEPMLFNDTILSNIIIGNPNHSENRLNTILDNIITAGVVCDLDMNVGENGMLLSGGQKQCVAIARALLKDAPIYILDESTSALDDKSKDIIIALIDTILEDKTVIMISHDPMILDYADTTVKL